MGVISEHSRLSEEAEDEERQPLRKNQTMIGKVIERARRAASGPEDPEEAKRKNAFFLFGFGIVAYLELIYTFFWLFVVLSVLLSPVQSFYAQHSGYQHVIGYESGMLGNMGASSAQCVNVPMDVDQTPLSCPYGTIGHIKDFGVTPAGADSMDSCLNNKFTKPCHDQLPPETKGYLNRCIGLTNCAVNVTMDTLYGDNLS